jgi:hypothetical protein
MVFSFRTGFYANGEVRMEAGLVAKKYLKTWFFIDFLSNFPLGLVLQSSQNTTKFFKLQKLPKMLRFGVLLKFMRQYAKYYNLLLTSSAVVVMLHMFT